MVELTWIVMLKVARFWQNVGLGLFWFTAISKSRIWKMADKMMDKNTKNFPILEKYISIKGSLISNPEPKFENSKWLIQYDAQKC